MTIPSSFPIDLQARAHLAMVEAGFAPDLSYEAARELRAMVEKPLPGNIPSSIRDLRALLWSSIDNYDSRDLDQVEVAERLAGGGIRVRVGVADVDAYVPKGSAIDRHASENTTSVYTGVRIFPMLPEKLSTDLTSLVAEGDRLTVVIEMDIGSDGTVSSSDVYRALVRNHAKLIYEEVGDWLEGRGPMPSDIADTEGLEEQIRIQNEAAEGLHAHRHRQGMLDFETIEASPVVENGQVVDLKVRHKNQAHYLIENFMIATNMTIARFLGIKGLNSIQRVLQSPERWSRITTVAEQLGEQLPDSPDSRALARFLARRRAVDPVHFADLSLTIVKLIGPGEYAVVRPGGDGAEHFGLAVHNYTHSTAPNRRYADLVTQRLLKSVLARKSAPYTIEELEGVAQQCTERENASRKVERLMRKVAAAAMLSDRIGEVFEAIVTGASPKGTYVRVIAPPIEGRVVYGEHGMDVGDRVMVRLIETVPEKGYIDFERAR